MVDLIEECERSFASFLLFSVCQLKRGKGCFFLDFQWMREKEKVLVAFLPPSQQKVGGAP